MIDTCDLCESVNPGYRCLPVHFHRELELPRIVGGRRLPRVRVKRTYSRDVVLVGDIEHVDDEIGTDSLGKVDALGNPHIPECSPGCDTGIAAEIAIQLQQRGRNACGDEPEDARLLENARGREFRIVSLATSRINGDVRTARQG